MRILVILNDFWPGIGQLWFRYQCQKLSMEIFLLDMTGLSKNNNKNSNDKDFLDEIADLGHFNPILACFWPIKASLSIFKALNEYSVANCDRIE